MKRKTQITQFQPSNDLSIFEALKKFWANLIKITKRRKKHDISYHWSEDEIKRCVLLDRGDGWYIVFRKDLVTMLVIDLNTVEEYKYMFEQMIKHGVEVITDLEKTRAERGISVEKFFDDLHKAALEARNKDKNI